MVIIAQGCLLSWFKKTFKKKRIATDLFYYYYGEIDYKINASLATAYELYIKKVF